MTDDEISDHLEKMKENYLNEVEGFVPGIDYNFCQTEGCPRTTKEGQMEACGLRKLGLPVEKMMYEMRCQAAANVEKMMQEGVLFD